MNNGSLGRFGRDGYDWSRSAMAYGVDIWAANTYDLGFSPSGVYPSNGPNARWTGFPVRCLVILVWTSSAAGVSPCSTVLYVALVLMLAVGLVLV